MTNNILKLAQQARTNAQLLTVSQGGIRSLTREDALRTRGYVIEAIRRLQVFEKDLAKKLDTWMTDKPRVILDAKAWQEGLMTTEGDCHALRCP